MFAQKTTSTDIQSIQGLVPRGLLGGAKNLSISKTTSEGLSPVRVQIKDGLIQDIEVVLQSGNLIKGVLLPRLVEPHAHIDKAFSWRSYPNLNGTYKDALIANLEEHKYRTIEKVRHRAEKSLNLALKNGLRAIRTHIDSFGLIGEQTWATLSEIKKEWRGLIELQLVALVPLEYWSSLNGRNLALKVANQNGFLGGVIVPPYESKYLRKRLINLFSIANELECGIDLHIDETALAPGSGLNVLLSVLDKYKLHVPITCSHLSSMGLISEKKLQALAERLADHNVHVIALPLTNFWLLARHEKKTPCIRPLAPIKQLQNAGVTVAIGCDNVQDPWYPGGDFDPFSLISSAMALTHMAPWNRLGLSTYTTGPSRILGLQWDGTLKKGSPADFVLLEADSWADIISTSPSRTVMVNGAWI